MKAKPRRIAVVLLGLLLTASLGATPADDRPPETSSSQAGAKDGAARAFRFAPLSAELPVSSVVFPPGKGSEIANAYCLMCHSAGMVLRQPALSVVEWTAEIRKMQAAFGAPIPADQVDELARYLASVNGHRGDDKPSTVDSQGS